MIGKPAAKYSFSNKKENLGHIYVLTSPSGNQYVGQAVCYYSNGKKAGYICRWKKHIEESRSLTNSCTYLDNAIRKYGHETFQIVLLEELDINKLNEREQHWIKKLNTMTPYGYNLTSGGGHGKYLSEDTKIKIKNGNIGKNRGKNTERKTRKRIQDEKLPKYVISHHSGNQEGYAIKGHPCLEDRYFVASNLTMEQKLILVIKYLNSNPIDIIQYKQSRKLENDNKLPKYLYRHKSSTSEGYYVKCPTIKYKSFFSNEFSNEEKLCFALKYLSQQLSENK